MKRFLLLLSALLVAVYADAATATVKKTWIDHGVTRDGVEGMVVHTEFSIIGQKGKESKIVIFIKDENGNYVKDKNGRYCSTSGDICFSERFTPSYDNSNFSDYDIFVPYDELHLAAGKHYYTAIAYINDMEKYIAYGSPVGFTGTGSSSPSNAAPQNNYASGGNNNSDGTISWKQELPNGGYCYYTMNPDGSGTATTCTPCLWCHGTKVCSICNGLGGVYGRAYGGMWYPCKSCGGTATCQNCHGQGYSTLVSTIQNGVAIGYDQNGNVYVGGGGSSYGDSSDSSSSSNRSGSGYDYMDVIEYAPNYTGNNNQYCRQCDKWGPAHVHIRKRY